MPLGGLAVGDGVGVGIDEVEGVEEIVNDVETWALDGEGPLDGLTVGEIIGDVEVGDEWSLLFPNKSALYRIAIAIGAAITQTTDKTQMYISSFLKNIFHFNLSWAVSTV